MKFHFVFLFLCFHSNILRADNTGILLEKTLSLYNNGEFTPPAECTLLLNSFADYASIFTKCSIEYARPVRLCERCIDHYINFRDKYEELVTKVVNGTTCKSIFTSHDRLDVVLGYHDSITAIWEKGKCNACFDWNMTTPTVSITTTNFTKYFNDTMKCIHDNNQMSNNTDVCQKCMMTYIILDEYYKSLSSDSIGLDSICMDIVDSMNTTRSIWSKSLGCCKLRKSPEIMFLACSGIISILPLLYYITVRYCGPIRDLPNVLKQSRFKQRLMRTGSRRIN